MKLAKLRPNNVYVVVTCDSDPGNVCVVLVKY